MIDWSKYPNFKESEFRCKCCGEALMDEKHLNSLQHLRKMMNIPLVISSGYRCPQHNQTVSSSGLTGPHTTGKAVDILIYGEGAFRLLTTAIGMKAFMGIGIKQSGPHLSRFIHLDSIYADPINKRPALWTY